MASVNITSRTPEILSGDITFIQITGDFNGGTVTLEASLDNSTYAPAMGPDGTPMEFISDQTFPVVTGSVVGGWKAAWFGQDGDPSNVPNITIVYI